MYQSVVELQMDFLFTANNIFLVNDKAPVSHNMFQIVEAMPQTKDVGNFMETLGSFYEIVDEDSPLDDDQMSRIPNHTGGGGSAGVTPDHSHSDTSSEHGRILTLVCV